MNTRARTLHALIVLLLALPLLAAAPPAAAHGAPGTTNDQALYNQVSIPTPGTTCQSAFSSPYYPGWVAMTEGMSYIAIFGAARTSGSGAYQAHLYVDSNGASSGGVDGFIQVYETGTLVVTSIAGKTDLVGHLLKMTNVTVNGYPGFWAVVEAKVTTGGTTYTHFTTQATVNGSGEARSITGFTHSDPITGLVGRAAASCESNYALYVLDASASMAPSAPANVTATAISSTSINVSWSEVTGASYYLVHASTSDGFSPSAENVAANTTSTYTVVSGLEPSTTYYFRVVAYDSTHAASPASSQASATTDRPLQTQGTGGVTWTGNFTRVIPDAFTIIATRADISIAYTLAVYRWDEANYEHDLMTAPYVWTGSASNVTITYPGAASSTASDAGAYVFIAIDPYTETVVSSATGCLGTTWALASATTTTCKYPTLRAEDKAAIAAEVLEVQTRNANIASGELGDYNGEALGGIPGTMVLLVLFVLVGIMAVTFLPHR